ncbi:hypothetical protein C0993_005166 [Termitomyces sp. T159_Od127]|nr:hypothetical protein C0993_005166 [Termitomyces sp. T159_Od127]
MAKTNYTMPRSRAFVANFHPLAARFNLKPHLSDDYRERYLKVFNEPTSSSSRSVFEAPSHATEIHATESIKKTRTTEERTERKDAESPATPNEVMPSPSLSPLLPPVYVQLTSPSTAFVASKSHNSDLHGFRHECLRVVATFLTPGSPKELPLDAIIRDTVINNLSRSCHPDIPLMSQDSSCTQIWRRGATQLRAWEMQETDTEAQAFVEGVLNQHKAFSQSAIALQEKSQLGNVNVSAIAPFAIETQRIGLGRPSLSSDTIPSYATTPPETTAPGHNLRRPPIFGPETVVLDPRIKAVHRQLVIDVHRFGVYLLLVCCDRS